MIVNCKTVKFHRALYNSFQPTVSGAWKSGDKFDWVLSSNINHLQPESEALPLSASYYCRVVLRRTIRRLSMPTLRSMPATELMSLSLIQALNSFTAKAADTPVTERTRGHPYKLGLTEVTFFKKVLVEETDITHCSLEMTEPVIRGDSFFFAVINTLGRWKSPSLTRFSL